MNAGVLITKLKLDGIDRAIQIYRDIILTGYAKTPGARGGQLWINRRTGDTLTVGIYDNEEAVRAFQPIADQARAALAPYMADPGGDRQVYELAASTQMETRALVEQSIRDFNAKDAEAAARRAAPDFVGTASGSEPVRGAQGLKEYNQRWFTAFPDAQVAIDRLTVLGNTAVLEGTFTGTHTGTLTTEMGDVPATGKKVSGPFVQVFEVDRGLFKSAQLTYDRMLLATQLGILPAMESSQR